MEKVAEASIEDVSARFSVGAAERVYRSVSGYLVRLTTRRVPAAADPSAVHFNVAGALLDDAGAPNVPPVATVQALTIHAESAVDVAAAVEKARETVVRRLEQAALHHAAAATLTGVD